MSSYPSVRQAFEDLARWLHEPHDTDATLSMLTSSALDAIPGVDYVSITVVEQRGRPSTLAPTDPLVVAIDDLQYELQQGPCYEAAVEGQHMLLAADLSNDPRWPEYGPRAAALGIGAQLALSLEAEGRSRAALNLYSKRAGGFDEAAELAEMFASHATLVMGYVRTVADLDTAVRSRTVIGQAIGILMERYDLDEDRAFGFLTRVSQTSNIKLREVAKELVDGVNSNRERGSSPSRPG
jgi:hypothetical protein